MPKSTTPVNETASNIKWPVISSEFLAFLDQIQPESLRIAVKQEVAKHETEWQGTAEKYESKR